MVFYWDFTGKLFTNQHWENDIKTNVGIWNKLSNIGKWWFSLGYYRKIVFVFQPWNIKITFPALGYIDTVWKTIGRIVLSYHPWYTEIISQYWNMLILDWKITGILNTFFPMLAYLINFPLLANNNTYWNISGGFFLSILFYSLFCQSWYIELLCNDIKTIGILNPAK